MKVKYIRRDIPEEISEEGGAYIQLVGKNTVGLTASIKEAIRMLYCVGEASLIEGYFFGLCRSVFAGIKADGAARSIGDIRFYPVCGGTFDLEKGWDPAVNDVRIKAQLVNGVELDISDWEFEDTTEGRVAFSVESVSDGETTGIVSTNKNVQVNGKNFPADVAVSWVCGTKSGDVAAAKLTRTVSRLDIDKGAVFARTLVPVGQKASLTRSRAQASSSVLEGIGPEDDGKTIVFTIKGSYNKVTKSAIVKYVATDPRVTDFHTEGKTHQVVKTKPMLIEGENLGAFDKTAENALVVEYQNAEGETSETIAAEDVASVSATSIVTTFGFPLDAVVGTTATIKVKIGDTTHSGTATVLEA